ncbi:MAG: hypothetical protein WCE68_06820 [Anaerolineales bacterium]
MKINLSAPTEAGLKFSGSGDALLTSLLLILPAGSSLIATLIHSKRQ